MCKIARINLPSCRLTDRIGLNFDALSFRMLFVSWPHGINPFKDCSCSCFWSATNLRNNDVVLLCIVFFRIVTVAL